MNPLSHSAAWPAPACLLICALFVIAATPLHAQVCDDVALCQETISSDFFGVDARAMAMGNSGLALTNDGSAIIYNPANLALIKRMELRTGLSHLRTESDSRIIRGGEQFTDGDELKRTRLSGVSLTVPVPTYRGSLVFGLGVHRVNSFDRAFARHMRETFSDGSVSDSGQVLETGSIWKWSAAAAMDISPNLSTGLALHVLTGRDEFRWNGEYSDSLKAADTETFLYIGEDQAIDVDYLGVSATWGINYAVSPNIRAGLTIETPAYLTAKEAATLDVTHEYDTTTSDYYGDIFVYDSSFLSLADYTVVRPFTFAFGLAGTFNRLNLTADARYTDYSQLDFNYDDPALDADESRVLRFIKDNLKETLSLHLGGEYLIPEHGVSLRAGYFRDPLPIAARFVEAERQYLTAGIGVLIDRIMTLDIAYVEGGYELRDADPGAFFAKYKTRRLFVTFGYRL